MPNIRIHLIILLLLTCGCAPKKAPLFIPKSPPIFQEHGTDSSLDIALNKHIQYLKTYPPQNTVDIANRSYSYAELLFSLQHFHFLYQRYAGAELNRRVTKDFTIYQAKGLNRSKTNNVLITGYFEPIFLGSPVPTNLFKYPLYAPPADLVSKKSAAGTLTGRVTESNSIIPYYTRKEIETEGVLAGYEIAYLQNPIDAFVLHVQGSGKLQFPDGEHHSFGYAGNNGHVYKSIGKLLVDEKKMSLEQTNMDSIRAYLTNHPEQQSRILHHNPRYIFFADKGNKAPVGSNGMELTAERSIAIDQTVLPWQTICFLQSTFPQAAEQGGTVFSSFMLPQDSGAAIKGPGRVDIFWGNGSRAKNIASHMKEEGKLYFLIKKGMGTPKAPTP